MHSKFINLPLSTRDAQVIRNGYRMYRLNLPFGQQTFDGRAILCPPHFLTNYATVPRLARAFLTPAEIKEAATNHDQLVDEWHQVPEEARHKVFDATTPEVQNLIRQIEIGRMQQGHVWDAVYTKYQDCMIPVTWQTSVEYFNEALQLPPYSPSDARRVIAVFMVKVFGPRW